MPSLWPTWPSKERDEAVANELRAERDAGHLSPRQYGLAVTATENLDSARLRRTTFFCSATACALAAYLLRVRRKPPVRNIVLYPSLFGLNALVNAGAGVSGLVWWTAFQLEADIRKDESTPLLLTVEDVQRRAELRLAARRSGNGDQESKLPASSDSVTVELSDGRTGNEVLHFDVGLDPLKAQELRGKTEQRWKELRSAEERYQKAKSKQEEQVREWQAQQVGQDATPKMTAASASVSEEDRQLSNTGRTQQSEDKKKQEWEDLLAKERAAADGRKSTRF